MKKVHIKYQEDIRVEYKEETEMTIPVYTPELFKEHFKKEIIRYCVKTLKKIVIFLIKIGVVIITGILTASIVIPMAQTERGYKAIGGEWFVIIAIISIVIYILNKLFEEK